MKKWALVILPLLIIIIFIVFYLFRGHKRVMEPELIEFFGGLDLGITGRQMKNIEPELSSYGSDLWSYCGRSKNNPILNLDLSFYDEYLIGILIGTASNDDIHASFHNDYIDAGGETSFEYWTDYFQNRLEKKPLHYFYHNDRDNSKVNIDLWHYNNYNFQIRKFVREDDINTDFSAYFDEDYVPYHDEDYGSYLIDMRNLYLINSNNDTIKVANYRPRVAR